MPQDDQRKHINLMLTQRRRNLRKLEQQAAIYAEGETPLRLLNQIEAEQRSIAMYEAMGAQELPDGFEEQQPQWMRFVVLVFTVTQLTYWGLPYVIKPFMPAPPPIATTQPTAIPTAVATAQNCNYAVTVRNAETDTPIHKAKLTLNYKLHSEINTTNSDGWYQGTFICDEPAPSYRLRIEADGYQSYHTEFTVQGESETIYLVSTATRLCPYVISVLDRSSLERIANAKVRVETGLYHATGYTTSEGDYASNVPCDVADAESLPLVTVWVYADGYTPYEDSFPLQGEVKEIRLDP